MEIWLWKYPRNLLPSPTDLLLSNQSISMKDVIVTLVNTLHRAAVTNVQCIVMTPGPDTLTTPVSK